MDDIPIKNAKKRIGENQKDQINHLGKLNTYNSNKCEHDHKSKALFRMVIPAVLTFSIPSRLNQNSKIGFRLLFYYLFFLLLRIQNYHIRPNYRTVRLGFSKLMGTLSCGKICIYLLRVHLKKIRKGRILMMIMRFFV